MKKIFKALTFSFMLCISNFIFAQSDSAIELFNKGVGFQNEEQWFTAVEYFRECLELNPQYGQAWYNLAYCSYYLGNFDLCIEYIDNAGKYLKNDPKVLNLKGLALIAVGKLDEAREVFSQVLKKYPNDIDSRFGLAELDLFDGSYSVAEGRYLEALSRDKTNRKALLSLALISTELGKHKEAEKYISQALEYHTGEVEVHYLASYIAAKRGNLKDAENKIRAAVQIRTDYDKAYSLLSEILYSQKRYNDVIDLCEFRINRNRQLSDAWYLMGLSYMRLDQFEKAIEVFETGLSINPEDEIMRLAMEQLVARVLPLEDPRRDSWASFHVLKADEYNRNYEGPSQRYEFQKALSVSPLNIDNRQKFALMLERDGLYELYLEQLKFIDENEEKSQTKSLTQIKNSDSMEALESLMKNNLSNRWDVNPFYLDKTRWNIGIYFQKNPVQLLHADLEDIVAFAAKDIFNGVSSTSVDVMSEPVESYGEAFSLARKSGRDYFVILTADESDRTFSIDAKVYSARTGTLTSELHVFRTGNDRVAKSLRRFRQAILDILPIRGKVVKYSTGKILIDLGKNDGVTRGSEFDVVKKNSIVTNDKGPGIYYANKDVLGKLKITEVNEEISEGEYVKKGFYDTLNLSDEVVLIKLNNGESDLDMDGNAATDTRPQANDSGEPATPEASKAERDSLKEDLKSHIKDSDLIRLIRDLI